MKKWCIGIIMLAVLLSAPTMAFAVGFTGGSGGGGASTLDQVTALGNTSTGNTEANPFEIFGSGAYTGVGWRFYVTSGGIPTWDCFVTTLGNCDKYSTIQSGKKWGLKDSAGNVDMEFTNTGDVISASAMTVDGETSGVSITLYRKLCGGELAVLDPCQELKLFDLRCIRRPWL